MKVVIDTNVIVSALLSSLGKPAAILNKFFNEELQAYYSKSILAEYEDVLSRPALKIEPDKAKRFFEILKDTGVSIEPAVSIIPLTDEDDRVFYDVAQQSDAILITGNRKHYPADDFVMTPSVFLDMLTSDEASP
jgi:putative PIN family toxin of toxin-antitoxin system